MQENFDTIDLSFKEVGKAPKGFVFFSIILSIIFVVVPIYEFMNLVSIKYYSSCLLGLSDSWIIPYT